MKEKDILHELVRKYEQNRDYYLTPRFNETMLRSEFLDPLFELFGWDIKNSAGKRTNEREVLLEEPLKKDASTHSKKPDYTFRLFGERKFFVEAKKPCVKIEVEDDPAKQVRRYGYSAGLKVSVLSNFEYLFIYDTSYPVKEEDVRTVALIKSYHYKDYENAFEEISQFLGKESVYSGAFDDIWKDIESKVSHQSVDDLFLAQINEWRLLLGEQILSVSPDMELPELGDIVQSYINKILFLRVCEDRNIETYQRLLQIAEKDDGNELIGKFREADRKYNSGLFAERLSSDIVCNIRSSFWTIIRQLYYPESPYSFSVLSSDILGRIYEIFIAQRLALVKGKLAIVNKPENEERDIVTTPTFIIQEILSRTIGEQIEGKNLQQLCELQIADIACGSGAFLLQLFQLLQDTLIDYLQKNAKQELIQTSINTYKLPFETKRSLLTRCIYGVDKDFNAVESCKFGLLLKLLEGEDVDSLSRFHPILPSLDENIFYGNSLLSSADVPEKEKESINPFDFAERRFDYIIGNPPYMKTEDIKNLTPVEHKLYPKHFKSAYKQYDKYFLFIERALHLLKEDGKLGYIVPSKFMKVGAAQELRRIIADGGYLQSILSFGTFQVFSDKSTYTCILVLNKKKNTTFHFSEVEDLTAWRVRNRKAVSISERNASCLSEDTWVLCSDEHQALFNMIWEKSAPLSDVVGDDCIFNGIQTSANKVYVFTPTRADKKYYYFVGTNKRTYKIEKNVTKPYFQTVQGEDNLTSFRSFEPNARVIFPYTRAKGGKLSLLKLKAIEKKYPEFFRYLTDFKTVLASPKRDIKPTPVKKDEWYRYGRSQSLEACEVKEKMIIGVLSQADKYAIDTKGTFVTSGGTAGYCMVRVPEGKHYSIYYIQAILGSIQGEWMASLYGEIFRGGYIARGTKVLKQLPIRTIDFTNGDDVALHDAIVDRQKRLIDLGDKMAGVKSNPRKLTPLRRQFDMLKTEQQHAINALYGMSEAEANKIPLIKELYAAD